MKLLLIALLFQLPNAQPAHPVKFAIMVALPLPHWHCEEASYTPKDYSSPVDAPVCYKPPSYLLSKMGYDWDREDKTLPWTEQHIIPDNRNLRIDYRKGLLRPPGCLITGDEHEYIRIEGFPDHLIIHGKPGQVLTFACQGVVSREQTKSNESGK